MYFKLCMYITITYILSPVVLLHFYFSLHVLFSAILLPSTPSLSSVPTESLFLFSWLRGFLQVIYTHLKMWSYDQQIRKNSNICLPGYCT